MAEIACEQRADSTLQQFYNDNDKHYCVRIGNTEILIYDAKCLTTLKALQKRIVTKKYHHCLLHLRYTHHEETIWARKIWQTLN